MSAPFVTKAAENFEGCQVPLEPKSQTRNHHGGEGTRAGSLARATVLSAHRLSYQPLLFWNGIAAALPALGLCRPGWLWAQRSISPCLLSAGLKGTCHHAWHFHCDYCVGETHQVWWWEDTEGSAFFFHPDVSGMALGSLGLSADISTAESSHRSWFKF